MNIGVCVCLFEWVFSFFLSIYPGVGLLDYTVVLVSVFWGKFPTVFIVAAPIYISTNSVQRFLFSTLLPMFVICRLFDSSLSDRSGIILQVMLYLIKLSFSCSAFITSLEHEKHIKHVCYCSVNVTLLIYLKVNLVSHWHRLSPACPWSSVMLTGGSVCSCWPICILWENSYSGLLTISWILCWWCVFFFFSSCWVLWVVYKFLILTPCCSYH